MRFFLPFPSQYIDVPSLEIVTAYQVISFCLQETLEKQFFAQKKSRPYERLSNISSQEKVHLPTRHPVHFTVRRFLPELFIPSCIALLRRIHSRNCLLLIGLNLYNYTINAAPFQNFGFLHVLVLTYMVSFSHFCVLADVGIGLSHQLFSMISSPVLMLTSRPQRWRLRMAVRLWRSIFLMRFSFPMSGPLKMWSTLS